MISRKSLSILQAQLIGIPLFQKEISNDMKLYEKEFKEAVIYLIQRELPTCKGGDESRFLYLPFVP